MLFSESGRFSLFLVACLAEKYCSRRTCSTRVCSRVLPFAGRPCSASSRLSLSKAVKITCRVADDDNPFDIIGVPRGASQSETRKVFRKLALTKHPDVNPDDPEAATRFQTLVAAYNTIMGDELMPDELTEIRVQATERYRQKINTELNNAGGLMYQGSARLVQGVATVAFFLILLGLANLPSETLNALLSPPPQTRLL